MDRQLLRYKSRQKFSVMKTKNWCFQKNSFMFHVLSWRLHKHHCFCFHYWDFLTNFWCNNWRSIFDIVERLCYCELLHSECKFLTMSLNFAETMLISNKFWRLLNELVNVHEIVLIFSCCIKCVAFAKGSFKDYVYKTRS